MKKLIITGLFASFLQLLSSAQAQVAPICPTNPYIYAGPFPGGGLPIGSNSQIAVSIRQLVSISTAWDFKIEDVTISGKQIIATAPGIFAQTTMPINFGIFGPIAAGNYTMTVTPIATNVTPNVACPPLTFPLTVVQAYEYVPVPALTGLLAALLAGLVGLAGVLGLRKIGSR